MEFIIKVSDIDEVNKNLNSFESLKNELKISDEEISEDSDSERSILTTISGCIDQVTEYKGSKKTQESNDKANYLEGVNNYNHNIDQLVKIFVQKKRRQMRKKQKEDETASRIANLIETKLSHYKKTDNFTNINSEKMIYESYPNHVRFSYDNQFNLDNIYSRAFDDTNHQKHEELKSDMNTSKDMTQDNMKY